MYYPYFISYMLAGVCIALIVFAWAMRNNQFRDQERARFLPLLDVPQHQHVPAGRVSRLALVAFIGLALVGVCTSVAVVVFALVKVKI